MKIKEPSCFVLLLDSDEDDYTLAKSMFHEAFGDQVRVEWFPRDGFSDDMICSGIYALIMVEYQIGLENGLEVIRKAKARCPDQVIFLVTDWPDTVVGERAEQAGADGRLNKNDLSVNTLQAIIDPYLRKGCQ